MINGDKDEFGDKSVFDGVFCAFSRCFSSEKCPTITGASFFLFFRRTTVSL